MIAFPRATERHSVDARERDGTTRPQAEEPLRRRACHRRGQTRAVLLVCLLVCLLGGHLGIMTLLRGPQGGTPPQGSEWQRERLATED